MDITINTPAILFPAISLIILAYTNRFLALSNRVRSLHEKYQESENKKNIHSQIKNMRFRIRLIKNSGDAHQDRGRASHLYKGLRR